MDIVNSIEEYLESHTDERPSVVGEFSFFADVVDDKESRNSELPDDSQVENSSAQKFVELSSKSAQSKGNNSAPNFGN